MFVNLLTVAAVVNLFAVDATICYNDTHKRALVFLRSLISLFIWMKYVRRCVVRENYSTLAGKGFDLLHVYSASASKFIIIIFY